MNNQSRTNCDRGNSLHFTNDVIEKEKLCDQNKYPERFVINLKAIFKWVVSRSQST